MQLLFVGQLSGLGGAERSLMPLAQSLEQRGHKLTLLLLQPPKEAAIFSQFPGPVQVATSRFDQLQQGLRAIAQADVVIATSELTPTYLTWLLCQWHHKPLIADVQVYLSQWIRDSCYPLHHQLCRWIYPKIPGIRCVAEGVAQDLQAIYQVPKQQIAVIPVPFDLEAISQVAQQSIAAAHEGIFCRPTLVAAGRFTSQKRFDLAIAALQQLHHKYQLDANLLILGEGALRPQLEAQVEKLGLHDRVFLPGFVANPHAYMRRAQAFLLTSDYEGLPRVVIEALAIGCPIVATNCPSGPDEILESGKHGWLVPVGDVDAIAQALASVLTQPDLAEQRRHSGQQRVQAYTLEIVAQQYEVLLQEAQSA